MKLEHTCASIARLTRPMNEYDIALVIHVRQRGVDQTDAFNRVVGNMALYEDNQFTSTTVFGDESGVTTLVRQPQVALIAPSYMSESSPQTCETFAVKPK